MNKAKILVHQEVTEGLPEFIKHEQNDDYNKSSMKLYLNKLDQIYRFNKCNFVMEEDFLILQDCPELNVFQAGSNIPKDPKDMANFLELRHDTSFKDKLAKLQDKYFTGKYGLRRPPINLVIRARELLQVHQLQEMAQYDDNQLYNWKRNRKPLNINEWTESELELVKQECSTDQSSEKAVVPRKLKFKEIINQLDGKSAFQFHQMKQKLKQSDDVDKLSQV